MRKWLRHMGAAMISLAILLALGVPMDAQIVPYSGLSRFSNEFPAPNFGKWALRASSGSTGTGSYSLTFPGGGVVTAAGAQSFTPFNTTTRITVGIGAVQETVTPTTVAGCGVGATGLGATGCTVTATFTYAHGAGTPVRSGSGGFDEAANVAHANGGGIVVVDNNTSITNALMVASTAIFNNVTVNSMLMGGTLRPWAPTPSGLALAAPSGVPVTGQAACDATHQACSDANVAGSANWGSTVFLGVVYMDCFGNEGPASATTSWTSVASKAIDIATPVTGNTGACGWVPYLSLSGGTYILAYQIPVTSSVCTLSTLTPIPSCSLTSTFGANALFNGGAQITTYPVNTAMTFPTLATTAQTITGQHPLTNSSLTYTYAPANRVGGCGWTSTNMVQLSAAGGINGSSATTVPQALGSWSIPANCFNYIGAEFRVSGKFTYTDGGSGTSTKVIVSWDANGTDTASVPTPLCSILDTFTSVAGADNVNWTCTVRVLTTGATGTALVNGMSVGSIAAGQTTLVRSAIDNAVAASASINLATYGRISVQFQATGATSNPGAQTLEATLEALN